VRLLRLPVVAVRKAYAMVDDAVWLARAAHEIATAPDPED
jgi:hypothetical protein